MMSELNKAGENHNVAVDTEENDIDNDPPADTVTKDWENAEERRLRRKYDFLLSILWRVY